MGKAASLLLFTLFLSIPPSVFAETNVNVSGNGEGSHTSVSVTNNVNSTSNSTTTSNSKTHVRIETNGEVKEYNSENGGSVHIESDDGTAKVNINNNGSTSNDTDEEMENGTKSAEEIEKVLRQGVDEQGETQDEQKNFFEKLKDFLKNLFF